MSSERAREQEHLGQRYSETSPTASRLRPRAAGWDLCERPGKALALQLADVVKADLKAQGWPEPIVADSGNGFHLNYAVDLPTADSELVERFLKTLSAKYSTPAVHVDDSLFNPSRILKLYGTWARKGDSIPSRPHRLARVVSMPETLEVVDRALIEEFIEANPLPEPEARGKPKRSRSTPTQALIDGAPGEITDAELSPVDDFNARAEWVTILEPHGWSIDRVLENGETRWTRPGKNGGTSATTGHTKGFRVFSGQSRPV